MRRAPLALCLMLAACAEGSLPDVVARDAAKSVVRPIVAENLPGVPADLVTDCIVDNATNDELLTLAGAAVTGVEPGIAATVIRIAQRPETLQCAGQSALAAVTA